jgi:hypothetical protein
VLGSTLLPFFPQDAVAALYMGKCTRPDYIETKQVYYSNYYIYNGPLPKITSLTIAKFAFQFIVRFLVACIELPPARPEAGFLVRVHPEPCLILSCAEICALLCSSKSKLIPAQTLTLLVLDKKPVLCGRGRGG